MKYYVNVIKYRKDDCGFIIENIPLEDTNSYFFDSFDDLVCLEYFYKRKIGKSRSMSSLIYNGTTLLDENGKLFFETNREEKFNIEELDTSVDIIISLINDIKSSGGIFNYFQRSTGESVIVKFLCFDDKGHVFVNNVCGILKGIDSRYIYVDNCGIHFGGVYSVVGNNINYVNPFVAYKGIEYNKYFSLIDNSYSLKRKKG